MYSPHSLTVRLSLTTPGIEVEEPVHRAQRATNPQQQSKNTQHNRSQDYNHSVPANTDPSATTLSSDLH